ncbi:hypothetical protein Sru01_46550 [Sphaerisporangium rufum]|uniref:Putative zinc-finger domain-containing protein n=1 Tax=Sphaerisporangium rufum TaxID=1381558 RepID=A0A919R5U5_9ACTN|nr:zf-HC2 domain-containing protein [Sphaerisporangium rufum]GII79673.1 hypothetical protein Sru01_46550 [Sphaerisporangium rufum]
MSTCDDMRMALGAHVLGALPAEEAVLLEAHLATCPECRAELAELSGLPALLGRVSEADIEQVTSPPAAVLDRLVTASARRRRLNRVMLGLAASVAAVVIGGTGWMAVRGPQETASTVAAPAQGAEDAAAGADAQGYGQEGQADRRSDDAGEGAADRPMLAQETTPPGRRASPAATSPPAAGTLTAREGEVRATLRLVPGGAGTTVRVTVTGVPGGTSCRLTAIGLDGTASPVGSWTVDGTAASTFTGHTELAGDRIRRFDIRTAAGERLVSVPHRR